MNQELLSLLTARVQRFALAPGGIPKLTAEDVAHALGRVRNRNAALLIGVKYGGRTGDIRKLDHALWLTILKEYPSWTKEKGYTKGQEFIRSMCQMALAEYMDDHLCPDCGGRSAKAKENLSHAFHDMTFCPTCNDSGKVYPDERTRARIMQIETRLWEKYWSDKYRKIQAEIYAWEYAALDDLASSLCDITRST